MQDLIFVIEDGIRIGSALEIRIVGKRLLIRFLIILYNSLLALHPQGYFSLEVNICTKCIRAEPVNLREPYASEMKARRM